MTGKLAKIIGLSAAALAISIGTAIASERVETRSLDVYSGPGSNYHKVDRLYRGDTVRIARTRGNWCFVRADGPDGWVRCGALVADNSYDRAPNITLQFGFGGFQAGPRFGGRPGQHDGGMDGGQPPHHNGPDHDGPHDHMMPAN